MLAFIALLCIPVFFVILIALVAAWEQRVVWAYVPADTLPPERIPALWPAAQTANTVLTSLKWDYLGVFGDAKGKLYKVRYDIFCSPDGNTLAVNSCGTVASLPVQTTWLHTLLSDGRCLTTLNAQAGSEADLVGLVDEVLVPGAIPFVLVQKHYARIEAAESAVVPFSVSDPLGDFRRFAVLRRSLLVERGLAHFLDADKTAWRYSIKGAVLLSVRGYTKGMRREFIPDTRA